MKCRECGSTNIEVKIGRHYNDIDGIRSNEWVRFVTCYNCGCRDKEYLKSKPKIER